MYVVSAEPARTSLLATTRPFVSRVADAVAELGLSRVTVQPVGGPGASPTASVSSGTPRIVDGELVLERAQAQQVELVVELHRDPPPLAVATRGRASRPSAS